MRVRSLNTEEKQYITGCWLIYGPTGSGKTYSIVTAPMPAALVNSEPRDPRVTLGGSTLEIDIIEPENFEDIMIWLNQQIEAATVGKCKYKTVYLDGLTFTMGSYRSALADDRAEIKWDKLTAKEQKEAKGWLRDKLSIEQADWGLMAEMMIRETRLLNTLSKLGVVVVATAIAQESPKWDRTLQAAPALLGRDYPTQIHGYFDFIGFLFQPWKLQEDGTVRPPQVAFSSPNGEYMTKACGALSTIKRAGDLNITRLLAKLNNGRSKDETPEVVQEVSEAPKLL